MISAGRNHKIHSRKTRCWKDWFVYSCISLSVGLAFRFRVTELVRDSRSLLSGSMSCWSGIFYLPSYRTGTSEVKGVYFVLFVFADKPAEIPSRSRKYFCFLRTQCPTPADQNYCIFSPVLWQAPTPNTQSVQFRPHLSTIFYRTWSVLLTGKWNVHFSCRMSYTMHRNNTSFLKT